MELLSPIGHDGTKERLCREASENRLAHGFIFSGIRGIGKASFAKWFAHFLLTDSGEDASAAWQRMEAGSHADFLLVSPLFDEKKGEFLREISADQGRAIGKFLSMKPAESRWRVVIIDSADQLNMHSANAILKILEEPPAHCILLLISHQPGLLLPTIRSRCQHIRFAPLAQKDFSRVMLSVLPDAGSHTTSALMQLTGGAPGRALELEEQGALLLYREILEIVADLPRISPEKVHAFSQAHLSSKPHESWSLITMLMLFLLDRACKYASDIEYDGITEDEPDILRRLSKLYPAEVWARKWQQTAEQFSITERLHLDYQQVIITFFHSLTSASVSVGAA